MMIDEAQNEGSSLVGPHHQHKWLHNWASSEMGKMRQTQDYKSPVIYPWPAVPPLSWHRSYSSPLGTKKGALRTLHLNRGPAQWLIPRRWLVTSDTHYTARPDDANKSHQNTELQKMQNNAVIKKVSQVCLSLCYIMLGRLWCSLFSGHLSISVRNVSLAAYQSQTGQRHGDEWDYTSTATVSEQ